MYIVKSEPKQFLLFENIHTLFSHDWNALRMQMWLSLYPSLSLTRSAPSLTLAQCVRVQADSRFIPIQDNAP